MIEFGSEIVVADSKEEAVAIPKQRIQDRDIIVDEENIYQIEDPDVLKEIEKEAEKRAEKEEVKANG